MVSLLRHPPFLLLLSSILIIVYLHSLPFYFQFLYSLCLIFFLFLQSRPPTLHVYFSFLHPIIFSPTHAHHINSTPPIFSSTSTPSTYLACLLLGILDHSHSYIYKDQYRSCYCFYTIFLTLPPWVSFTRLSSFTLSSPPPPSDFSPPFLTRNSLRFFQFLHFFQSLLYPPFCSTPLHPLFRFPVFIFPYSPFPLSFLSSLHLTSTYVLVFYSSSSSCMELSRPLALLLFQFSSLFFFPLFPPSLPSPLRGSRGKFIVCGCER